MGRLEMNVVTPVWALGAEDIKEPFLYKGCGLDDIWLVSGYDLNTDEDGERTATIRNLDGLLKAIGISLVSNRKLLSGREVRFLRVQMDLTQSELARLLGCDAQQIARYEKGENRVSGPVSRIIRMLYSEHAGGTFNVRKMLEDLDQLDSRIHDKLFFRESAGAWSAAAA
jgi:putative transcriptional regulator